MDFNKIIAYFVHKSENSFIKSHIDFQHETDSFIIGEATSEQQSMLENKNIIFNVLDSTFKEGNRESVANKSMAEFRDEYSDFANRLDIFPFPEIEEEEIPGFYKLLIKGPLLAEYSQSLAAIEVEISEFIPVESSYVVRIESISKYNAISELNFVEQLSYYSGRDTGIYIDTIGSSYIAVFDILLQRPEDLETFLSWLSEQNIKVLEANTDKIRLQIHKDRFLAMLIARDPRVRYMYEYIPPKFFNDLAGKIIGTLKTNVINSTSNLEFDGDGQIIGIADTGIDINHPDLQSQLAGSRSYGIPGNVEDTNGHGTHVAGSIVGDGSASGGKIKGIAPKAKVYFQSLLDAKGELALPLRLQDLYDDAYRNGVRIHNNSWGASTESKYTVSSVEVDDFVYTHKDMLLVFAAGNNGSLVRYNNVPKGDVDFYSISSPGSAKNTLTVGCSRSSRTSMGFSELTYKQKWPDSFPYPPFYDNECISGDYESMAGFSSRGPCDDDRIKPDVVAPGTDIVSTKSELADLSNFWGGYVPNEQYALMGGTSMSSPIVSGFAALVREFYMKKKNVIPSAALLKATIINGCKKLNGRDSLLAHPLLPNFNQGYGLIDASRTIPSEENDFRLYFVDNYKEIAKHFVNSGENFRLKFKISTPGSWLRICLAYTDYPARALQNNLNLMLSNKVDRWLGNQDAKTMLKSLDNKNNVEVIIIEDAAIGTYTLQVVASNIIKGPQDFALVITTSDININI